MAQRLSRIGFTLAAFVAALLGSLVVAPGSAEAAIDRCDMIVSNVTFSPYDTVNRPAVDSTGTIEITCYGSGTNLAASVHINFGLYSTTCGGRRMGNGANRLSYQIYQNATRTTTFCNGGNRRNLTFNLSGGSQTQIVTMYGRVAALQNPPYSTTAYTDTLRVDLLLGTGGASLATQTITVSSMVAAICSVSAGSLGFGSYSGAIANSTATVTVNCTGTAPYSVSMGGGNNLSGAQRRMAGPAGNYLRYELFSDSARLVPWGDDSALLGARRGGTGSGSAQALTVYGRIPAGQFPGPGSYSDSVLVTIDY